MKPLLRDAFEPFVGLDVLGIVWEHETFCEGLMSPTAAAAHGLRPLLHVLVLVTLAAQASCWFLDEASNKVLTATRHKWAGRKCKSRAMVLEVL